MEQYSLYSPFDIQKHKETFVNYLEVIITEDGKVMYAVPSHQELMIKTACIQQGKTRDELIAMCPQEYYADFTVWLSMITGCIAVWNDFCMGYETTPKQEHTLKLLKLNGLYRGPIKIQPKTNATSRLDHQRTQP